MEQSDPPAPDPEILAKLAGLPDEIAPSFAGDMRHLLASTKEVLPRLTRVLSSPDIEHEKRFAALYGILVWHWRNSDFDEYAKVVSHYQYEFGEHPLFPSFRAQQCLSTAIRPEQVELALEFARVAVERAPELPGVRHLFAEIVAALADLRPEIPAGLIAEGLSNGERALALSLNPYAKYFATRARLLAQLGRFDEAYESIRRAVSIEPSGAPQYVLRLADYQAIRLKIDIRRAQERLGAKQAAALARLEEVRSHVIELLGLLSAVIAFLLTSTQIATHLGFRDAARLMIILCGGNLVTFSAFSLVFSAGRPRVSTIIAILLGFALASLAFFPTSL